MCGIIGYTGKQNATEILIDGLGKLEYRGYDSAGIAVIDKDKIEIRKSCGKVESLKNTCQSSPVYGHCGIGHTRWATHGKADLANCHPHTNSSNTIAVVHNGIIENYMELRLFLSDKGYKFKSETDTEVIPHLVDYYYSQCYDFLGAVRCAEKDLEGSYAAGIICSQCPGEIICICRQSPLVIGVGKNGNYICSDHNALSGYAESVYIMEDGEVAAVTAEGVSVWDEKGRSTEKKAHRPSSISDTEKGEYTHFMLKEIYQQPHIIHKLVSENISLKKKTAFAGMEISDVQKISKLFIVGCGTAYHAALIGKRVIEEYAKIPVEVYMSSEFRYTNPLLYQNALTVAISQSGETADTLAAMKLAKEKGGAVLAITNIPGSTAARIADFTFLTAAGAEISVASTKAYTAQLAVLYIFAIFLAERKGIGNEPVHNLKNALIHLPKDISATLALEQYITDVSEKIKNENHLFYIGRGLDYVTACEGALKMKEITYIHAEAYAAGELKHGPIALIDKGTIVIALSTDERLQSKISANISEVKSRGADVIYFSPFKEKGVQCVPVPQTHCSVSPFVSVVALQLLSYYTALERGCDVDTPRNLAKSVTVE